MCDQNIAVSIRTLSQMSSIVPNSIEKIKVTSFAAGLVAGFTTDCNYGIDTSIGKGYTETVAPRVDHLANVLKQYVVLNTSWYNTGAKTISEIRNIFITGRKHPLNTLANVFKLVNNVERDRPTLEALTLLNTYGLSLDVPFHRLITGTQEEGLLKTLLNFNDGVLKSAQRITSEGHRLDILDNQKLSVINSTIAGLVIGYTEPLPSTAVDFDSYYATTAYPFAMSLVNELVEKLNINTDIIFSVYRDTLETRYELLHEPVKVTHGTLALIRENNILPSDMLKAISDTNTGELIKYVANMIDGVYKVRADNVERSVLHQMDYLPINPVAIINNSPESLEQIREKFTELVSASEAYALATEDILKLKYRRSVVTTSMEALSGRQALGIAMIIMGGALMAYAVYVTFFKRTAEVSKDIARIHKETADIIKRGNEQIATYNAQTNALQSDMAKRAVEYEKRRAALKVANSKVKTVTTVNLINDMAKGVPVEECGKDNDIFFTLTTSNDSDGWPDYSHTPINIYIDRFSKYVELVSKGELEKPLHPDNVKKIGKYKDIQDMCNLSISKFGDNRIALARQTVTKNVKGNQISLGQLKSYIKLNVGNQDVFTKFDEIERYCNENAKRMDAIDPKQIAGTYETIIKEANPDISESDLKETLRMLAKATTAITDDYKHVGRIYLNHVKFIRGWDALAHQHVKKACTLASNVLSMDIAEFDKWMADPNSSIVF